MNCFMKKYTKILFAAALAILASACTKEELRPEAQGAARTFTVGFDQTKTSLAEGKTVWAAGDTIWVSNGTDVQIFGVPAENVGQKTFTFLTTLRGDIYTVYPHSAAKGISDGKIGISLPQTQDGTFGSANIAVAKVKEGDNIALQNVTAIVKFTIPAGSSVKAVTMKTAGNISVGDGLVDLTSGKPVVTTESKGKEVIVVVDGIAGNYYASVLPGNYVSGFTLTAVSAELSVEAKTSQAANEVAANDIFDFGTLGQNLKPLGGDGTETSPWLITNTGEMLALAYYVNEGNDMAEEHVKLMDDIPSVSTTVGYFDSSVSPAIDVPFRGEFDGNGKIITLDIDGDYTLTPGNIGLFGEIQAPANIHDLTLAGTVTSTSYDVAALVGFLSAAKDGNVKISKVTNNAIVKGTNNVGGIVGYSNGGPTVITIDECTNNGAVTASGYNVGGIAGGMRATTNAKTIKNCTNTGAITTSSYCAGGIVGYYANAFQNSSNIMLEVADMVPNILTGCKNTGAVETATNNGNHYYSYYSGSKRYVSNYTVGTTDRGTGGIVGYAATSTITNCENSGEIKAINKGGGVAGFTAWCNVEGCKNSGNVTVTSYITGSTRHEGLAGGILGGCFSTPSIKKCENSGKIQGNATVGGIIGIVMGGNNDKTTAKTGIGIVASTVDSCKNVGAITAKYGDVGGIAGIVFALNGPNKGCIKNSINEGMVVSEGTKAGGIAGELIDVTGWSRPSTEGCVNKGNVTAQYWVGGIVGYGGSTDGIHTANGSSRGFTTHRFWIQNCTNEGNVLGNRKDSDSGEVAGGIIGACFFGSNKDAREYMGIELYNCLNTGNVNYEVASHKSVYCGGIVGRFGRGCLYNVVNTGKVGPLTGEPVDGADARMGAIVGSAEATANRIVKIANAYYQEGTYDKAYGTASAVTNPAPTFVVEFAQDGVLADAVTINSIDCTNFIEACNAWVNNRAAFFDWANGPKLVAK